MPSLNGVLPALLTPLADTGELDHAGMDRLLDHVLAAPLAGISPCGSTGEGPLLPRQVRVDAVRAVAARLAPGQWLVPGASGVNAEAALQEIEAYAAAGATAVLVPPPWYYPIGAGEVLDFFTGVADRSAVPVVLYNIPAMTKVVIPVPTVAQLAAHPKVLGIKDSSRDFEYFQGLISHTATAEDFAVLTGTDTMLVASMLVGGAGTIAASVNIVPSLVQDLYDACLAGKLDDARALQERVVGVVAAARRAGFPRGWKAAAEALGLCSARTAHPLRPASPDEAAALTGELKALGVC